MTVTQSGTTPVQNSFGADDASSAFVYLGIPNWAGWVRTDPIKVPRGTLNRFRMYVQGFAPNTGSSYSWSVDNLIGLIVPCPWVAWGLPTATP